jgi:hypothetical protein
MALTTQAARRQKNKLGVVSGAKLMPMIKYNAPARAHQPYQLRMLHIVDPFLDACAATF